MTTFVNHYKVLGISRNATQEEIKKAYRELAKKYHPDTHQDKSDEEISALTKKFQEISTAYNILSDSTKKQKYDIELNFYESKKTWSYQESKRQETYKNQTYNYQQRQQASSANTKNKTKTQSSQTTSKENETKQRSSREYSPISDGSRVKKMKKDIAKSWEKIKREEQEKSFKKRHQALNDEMSTLDDFFKNNRKKTDEIIYKSVLHTMLEIITQLDKILHITEDTIPEYLFRNRKLISTILAVSFACSLSGEIKEFVESTITHHQTSYYTNDDSQVDIKDELIDTFEEEQKENLVIYRTYYIQENDNLYDLAQDANCSIEEIRQINELDSYDIKTGNLLYIPYYIAKEDIHYTTISVFYPEGTTLEEFAKKYSTDAAGINCLNEEAIENGVVLTDSLLVPTFTSKKQIEENKSVNQKMYYHKP